MTEPSDPFTLLARELGDRTLTPDQLAQVRALNTRYFTRLYAIRAGRKSAVDQEGELAVLHDRMLAEIRSMLTLEQRAIVDRRESTRDDAGS